MKRSLFIILFCLSSFSLFAQSDTTIVYVDENFKEVKNQKNTAFIFRSFQKDSSWVINVYNKENKVIKSETYSGADLLLAHGLSVEYENGRPILKGMFLKGKKTGPWLTYNSSGKLLKHENYFDGRLHGTYREYNENGEIREEGNYNWNIKKGEWKFFYNDGKLASLQLFDGENAEAVKEEFFDTDGNTTTREKVRTPAIFQFKTLNFRNYISQTIVKGNPNMLNLVGKVECSFTIDKNGNTKNIKVVSSSGNFVKEARMAILGSPKWKPATLFGEVIESENVIILTFVR